MSRGRPAVTDVDAVLFDMDGTLVDSDGAVARAWRAWSADYGLDFEVVHALAAGSPTERTIRVLFPTADDGEVARIGRSQLDHQYDDLADIVAVDGAIRSIAAVEGRGLPWVVVTSADRRLAGARLAAAGIVAPVLVTYDDVTRGKPDPESYLLAANLLETAPERCLVVEDADNGVAAGRAAGCWVAGVRGVEADLTFAGLDELADWLSG